MTLEERFEHEIRNVYNLANQAIDLIKEINISKYEQAEYRYIVATIWKEVLDAEVKKNRKR